MGRWTAPAKSLTAAEIEASSLTSGFAFEVFVFAACAFGIAVGLE
jgi:hypothetical protein